MTEAARERTLLEPIPRSLAPVEPVAPVRFEPMAGGWQLADALVGVAVLLGIFVAANADRMPRGADEFLAVRLSLKNVLLLTAFAVTWPTVLWSCGMYDSRRLNDGRGEWPRVMLASAVAGVVALIFPLTSQSGASQPIHALLFGLIVAPSAMVLRAGVRVARQVSQRGQLHRVIMVGSGPLAVWAYRGLNADGQVRREVVGFVDSDPQPSLASAGIPWLGGVRQLERLLMHEVVDEVFISLPMKSRYEEIQQAILACERVGIPATYPAPFFRTTLGRPRIERRADRPVMAVSVAPDDARLALKRVIDVVGATLALVGYLPVMLLIAAAIKLTSPGPVFFAQERYGYMKRRFRMLKFRTMVAGAERQQTDLEARNEAAGPVFKIRDDPRITPLGRFLRRSSLDELPQLWHVITGDMSLVGPRPLPVRDVGRFPEPWLMRRFSMRPGLTCLWQISGRSDLSFDQWITLDLKYIDSWSLGLDLAILLRTVPAVLKGRGAT